MKSFTITAAILSMAICTLASVTCVTVGKTATATWVNAAEETCTFVGVVGSNYGETTHDGVSGEYVSIPDQSWFLKLIAL